VPDGAAEKPGVIPADRGGCYLLIDKPAGKTSHDVVDRVRRITGEKKVGHAGTLDPMATGLLVIALGRATRSLTLGLEGGKSYRAVGQLGLLSPTGDEDADWTIPVRTRTWRREEIEAALNWIAARNVQVPPMVSAIKRAGIAMHKLARRGWWLEQEARHVTIDSLKLIDYTPGDGRVELEVAASGGFYVRSLLRDLGCCLGVPAALTGLRRLQVGGFRVEDAITLDQLQGSWTGLA